MMDGLEKLPQLTKRHYVEGIGLSQEFKSLLKSCIDSALFWKAMEKLISGVTSYPYSLCNLYYKMAPGVHTMISGFCTKEDIKALYHLILCDCIKCHKKSDVEIDLQKHTGYPILLLYLVLNDWDYSWNSLRYTSIWTSMLSTFIHAPVSDFENIFKDTIVYKENNFFFTTLFSDYSALLVKQYYRLMYRFSLLVIQNQTTITDTQSKWLADLFLLSI